MPNKSTTSGKTCIYALCELKHTHLIVRYVGRARNPKSRRAAHIQESQQESRSRKCAWIRELRAKGKTPLMIVLASVDSSVEEQEERRWINHFSAMGCKLTNGC